MSGRLVFHPAARTIEQLLAIKPYSLTGVERCRDGAFALELRAQRAGGRTLRALHIPAGRVLGYTPRTLPVRACDVRARSRASRIRFAIWLLWRVPADSPIIERALTGDLAAVDELRDAIVLLTDPPA